MSTKHYFAKNDNLALTSLKGAIATNPAVSLIEDVRVVYDANHPSSQVALISGGGSGHEPWSSGNVAKGMLAAAVCGDIFASPSAKQVTTAIKAVGSKEGTILIITNYTGDMLHFGLGAEIINSEGGAPVGCCVIGDDCAVPRSKGGLVGRRGLAGTPLTAKILGAAAQSGMKFKPCMELGQAIANNVVTLGTGLDHCHIPGRGEDFGKLDDNVCEIGLGIHNEPGFEKVSPVPEPKELVRRMLKYMLDPNDPERAFVPFKSSDEVVLLMNNLGGVSTLEMGALTNEFLEGLEKEWSIRPVRVIIGTLMTSLNGPSFSATLLNVTRASQQSSNSSKDILGFLDAETASPSWPRNPRVSGFKEQSRKEQLAKPTAAEEKLLFTEQENLKVDPSTLEKRLEQACQNIIAREPDLTEWDSKMGDGDCGETLKTGAQALLSSLKQGLASKGSVLEVVAELVQVTENKMGGTLGAILAIFFSALLSSLRATGDISDPSARLAKCASSALENLKTHTPARKGDRTVMDVLIPYCEALSQSGPKEALKVAEEAAEGTRKITPKLGRSVYIGGLDEGALPPDPGAYGIYEIIKGISG